MFAIPKGENAQGEEAKKMKLPLEDLKKWTMFHTVPAGTEATDLRKLKGDQVECLLSDPLTKQPVITAAWAVE